MKKEEINADVILEMKGDLEVLISAVQDPNLVMTKDVTFSITQKLQKMKSILKHYPV